MNIDIDEVLISENTFDFYQSDWIQDNYELIEDDKYSVYYGTGNSSLVKLLIKEEILEIESI